MIFFADNVPCSTEAEDTHGQVDMYRMAGGSMGQSTLMTASKQQVYSAFHYIIGLGRSG